MPTRFFRHPLAAFALCACAPLYLAACYAMRPGQGGGQAKAAARSYSPSDIALPAGYRIEPVAEGLTFPTAAVFGDSGALYVTESGYAYGGVLAAPRLLKILGRNRFETVAASPDSNGPWTGAAYAPAADGRGGEFYVAEGGHRKGGRILRIGRDGSIEPLVENLPSFGDHHTNGPALGPDGMIYFGQGTATNSGVVGEDNAAFGWLRVHPDVHDIPCQDIVLAGVNYRSKDKRLGGAGEVETGAFSPFGTATARGKRIPGEIPCNGAILRIARPGSAPVAGAVPGNAAKPELVAWGFRNPYALAFTPDGRLFALDNGYDERGSRPIWGAGDLLWEVHQGRWYGWPDWSGSKSVDHSEFTRPHGDRPLRLLERPPDPWLATQASAVPPSPEAIPDLPPAPAAVLPVHASADGLDFSPSEAFGHKGQAFVAQFGDMAPDAGKVLAPVGFKIVRVDVAKGVSEDFAVNRKGPGPASRLNTGGLERPVSLRFSPDGASLYVVDFGVMTMGPSGPQPRPGTGCVWRITRAGGN